MRIVKDYDVDRLGVEVQQCMELTSTNNSIDLQLIFYSILRLQIINNLQMILKYQD